MEEAKLQTLAQIKAFLDGTLEVAFRVPKDERNPFIEPPCFGYAQRKSKRLLLGTLKRASKGTFEVYNSVLIAQYLDFIEGEIMVPPNLPDKSTIEKPPKLLDQVRDKLRVKHYSIRTEQTYSDWIKRFIFFHGKRHPKDMGAQDVEAFLTHLAVVGKVSASTQNQAKSALLFLIPRSAGNSIALAE